MSISVLRKKIPLLYIFLSAILGSLITFGAIKIIDKNGSEANAVDTNTTANSYNIRRLSGYKYIRPLVYAEPVSESEKYAGLKADMMNYTDSQKRAGWLTSASVYLRDFNKADWIAINPEEQYDPGSLLKVGVLITYLRMAETNPTLLNSEVVYHGRPGFRYPVEHYRSDTVKEGQKYTVRELLRYMITCSDNHATLYLENYMDTTLFKKEFTDLGMSEPHFQNHNYQVNVKEYSSIMKALYNAGYLSIPASEYATSLLTESKFREGLVKELPASVKVAHKFGEAGNPVSHELHESGIIYIDKNPYLLTVMTRGTDWDKLSEIISHISKMAYDKMNSASLQKVNAATPD